MMNDLYQDLILDHNKNPRNYGTISKSTHVSKEFNPLCGDEITLYLDVRQNILYDIKFQGNGCAISKASASLMSEEVLGKTTEEILKLVAFFIKNIVSNNSTIVFNNKLDVFSGVSKFPNRVRCATLAWHALANALKKT